MQIDIILGRLLSIVRITGRRGKLLGIELRIIQSRPLHHESIDGHLAFCCITKFCTMTGTKDFPNKQSTACQIESIENNIPCPPCKQPVNVALRYSARGAFKKVYDVEPELRVIKITIY